MKDSKTIITEQYKKKSKNHLFKTFFYASQELIFKKWKSIMSVQLVVDGSWKNRNFFARLLLVLSVGRN